MKVIKYPKTKQFRQVVKDIKHSMTFRGLDGDGKEIHDRTIEFGKMKAIGRIKLHGTNGGFCFNDSDGLWKQSKENVISIEKDNLGFAFFCESREKSLMNIINSIKEKYNIDTSVYTISVYGEFVGKKIQKGVGISELEKSLFIFRCKISNKNDKDFNSYWVSTEGLRDNENRIYNIDDYKKYEIEIDFDNPSLSQNLLSEYTLEVEKECPVAKEFGYSGIGEGLVWTIYNEDGSQHIFKTKGDKHSVTKVKKIASVNIEKLNSIKEFSEYAMTQNRFEQAIGEVFKGEDLDTRKIGDLMRWLIKDIMSEEIDTLVENNLEPKDVNSSISNIVRKMFFEQYN